MEVKTRKVEHNSLSLRDYNDTNENHDKVYTTGEIMVNQFKAVNEDDFPSKADQFRKRWD